MELQSVFEYHVCSAEICHSIQIFIPLDSEGKSVRTQGNQIQVPVIVHVFSIDAHNKILRAIKNKLWGTKISESVKIFQPAHHSRVISQIENIIVAIRIQIEKFDTQVKNRGI